MAVNVQGVFQHSPKAPEFTNALERISRTMDQNRQEQRQNALLEIQQRSNALDRQIQQQQFQATQDHRNALLELQRNAQAFEQSQPIALAPNTTLIDRETRQPIAKGARPSKLLTPKELRQQKELASARRPITNIDTKKETKFGEEIGKFNAKAFIGHQNAGKAAIALDDNLDLLEGVLSNVETGPGTQWIARAKGFAKNVLGFEPEAFGLTDDVGRVEAATALSNLVALKLRTTEELPASGFSDADREFLQAIPPSVGQTKEGRALVGKLLRKKNRRAKEIAGLARRHRNQNGGRFDEAAFVSELAEFSASRPIFTDQDRQELQALANPVRRDFQGRVNPAVPGTFEFEQPAGDTPSGRVSLNLGAPDAPLDRRSSAPNTTVQLDGNTYVKRGDRWFRMDTAP